MKILGLFFKILLGVVLVAGLSLFALGYYYNTDRLKPMVVTYVQDHYKRTISIGDVSWRLFPRLGISIQDISLGNAPGYGEGNFAVFKAATIFVNTMELFSGRVNVSTIELQAPSANLTVNKQGQGNWEDLTASKATTQSDSVKSAPQTAKSGISDLEFNIDSIEIIDGALSYQDQQTGEKYEITKLNLSSESVALGKDFPVDLKLNIVSNAPTLNTDFSVKGKMRIAADTTTYDLKAITISGDLAIANLQANGIKVSNFKTPLKLENGVLDMSNMSANLYGGTVSGSMKVNAVSQPADVAVNYDMKGTDITSLTKDLGVKQNFSGKLNMKGNLRFKAYPDKPQLTRSVTGTAAMNIQNGSLLGVDLAYWYNTGLNLMKARNVTDLAAGAVGAAAGSANSGKTDFLGARANFDLNGGLITNKDLNVYTAKIYGQGAGTINLISQNIDYRFNISGVEKSGDSYKPTGQSIPLIISGSINNPKMNVDVKASVGNVIQNLVQPQNGTSSSSQQQKGGVGGAILKGLLQ